MKKTNWNWLVFIALFLTAPAAVSAQYDRWPDDHRREERSIEGRWYSHGDHNKRVAIFSTRNGLQAINEHGQSTRLEYHRGGVFRALDREGGLRGDIRRGRIEWENGTFWTRSPYGRGGRHR